MPRKNITQTDFSAGEISPRMEMREDLEGRKHAMSYIENWRITPEGTIITSQGTEYVASVAGTYGRVFKFVVDVFTRFAVSVTKTLVRIYDQIGVAQTATLVANSNFDFGSTSWIFGSTGAGSVSFGGGACTLTGGTNETQDAWIRQALTVVIGHKNKLAIELFSGDGVLEVNIGTTLGGSEIYAGSFATVADVVIEDLICSTTTMYMEVRVSGPSNIKILNRVDCFDMDVSPVYVSFTSPWVSDDDIRFMQRKMTPTGFNLYLTSPGVITQVLSYNRTTKVWTLAPISFTAAPVEWVSGSYPVAIEFFEGRLYLAGSRDNPNRIWASKSNAYTNFTTGALADDALSHDLERQGRIRWLAGSQNMVIGTDNTEYILTSTEGVIIPGDIKSRPQSSNGSMPHQCLDIGSDVLYISADGRRIRKIGYEWAKDAWISKEVNFASTHLTMGNNKLTNLLWAPNPSSLLVATTANDGVVVGTYESLSGSAGFYRRTTQGIVIDACVIPSGGEDEIWVLVDRSEGAGIIYLERYTSNRYVKLDSHVHKVSSSAITEIYAPHLIGKECQILVDGAVHPNATPVAGTGKVTLEFGGKVIDIGLKIHSIAKTLPIADAINPIGTTRGMVKRWVKIFMKLINSYPPLINGVRGATRHAFTPMGVVESPRSETIQGKSRGTDLDAIITIEQDLPIMTEISGIFGQIEQEEI
jgi:hypothetical protein